MRKLNLIVLTFFFAPSASSHYIFLLVDSSVFHYKVSPNAYGLLTLIHTLKGVAPRVSLKILWMHTEWRRHRTPSYESSPDSLCLDLKGSPLKICYFLQVETSSSCP